MIFISHAHVNKPEARRLVEVLLKFGLWLDEQRLDTG